MKKILKKLIINALGLAVTAYIVPGFEITNPFSLIIAAVLLGFANACIRPILIILTLPLTIFTIGFFLLILNGILLGLVAYLVPGFSIHGLWSAVLGWLMLFVVSWVVEQIFDPNKTSRKVW